MRAALITITCQCGEINRVPYGDRWRCPKCGIAWNTAQIPADEYWGIMRRMHRFRVAVIGLGVALGAVAVVFAVVYQPLIVLLVPVLVGAWQAWSQRMWRRRVRRATQALSGWRLTPE
jgi:hypothetical protein